MRIKISDLKQCLDIVSDVALHYRTTHIGSDNTERSVDDLIQTCKVYLGKEIKKLEVKIVKEDSPVYASFFIDRDYNYIICFVEGLNHCWTRFVICKEVFHVILDNERFHSMSIDSLVTEMTVPFPENDKNDTPSPSAVSETLAGIAAMEFLFPYRERVSQLSMYGDNINYGVIAEKYRIPLVMVEKYLSKNYMDKLLKYSTIDI